MTTYEEWRVTGHPGNGYGLYCFTFSPINGYTDAEKSARGFIALHAAGGVTWTDGPHLHKRTVTVTDWEAIEP